MYWKGEECMRCMNVNRCQMIGLFLLLTALFLPITIQIRAEQWTQPAINAENLETMTVGPINLYSLYSATTQYGILKSSDHGDTWTATIMSSAVYDIAVHPQAPFILYAGDAFQRQCPESRTNYTTRSGFRQIDF